MKKENLYEIINKKLDEGLKNKKKLLMETYFEIYDILSEKFQNVILLMEIGSFYEIYEYNNKGKAKEISSLLNIQLTKKNKSILDITVKNPLMTGFPNHALDKYLSILLNEEKYTIVIVKQEGKPPNIKRYLKTIISPSVNTEDISNKIENYIIGIYIEKERTKNLYKTVFAGIDLNTGNVKISYSNSTIEDKNIALDNLYNLLISYSYKEILMITKNLNDKEINNIITNFDLKDKNLILKKEPIENENYFNELLKKVYNKKTSLISIDKILGLEDKNIKLTFSLLLEYIIYHFSQEDTEKILSTLKVPELLNNNNFVYLGNNPIKQLEIDKVLKLIDKTKTPMGRRLLKERLFNPIFNIKELEDRYKKIEFMLKGENYKIFEKHLQNIYDIERLNKRIISELIHPYEIKFIYESLKEIKYILKKINKKEEELYIEEYLNFIEKHFIIDKMNVKKEEFKENYINPEFNIKIKNLLDENEIINKLLNELKNNIEEIDENIKIEIGFLEKEGYVINITKNKWKLIEKNFSEKYYTPFENKYFKEKIFFGDFKIRKLTSTVKITGGILEKLSEEKFKILYLLEELVKENFQKLIEEIKEKYTENMENIINIVAEIDIAVSNAKISKMYKYTKPVLINNESNNLDKRKIVYKNLYIKDLRHPLIEANEENGVYIPNDINFDKYQGMLLYGINSSGKSSLMKSVGIAVFLAQAGLFVPATKMYIKPYKKLFTRIESHDNLSKGLSTFAVEMLELKNILNRCDNNSLILGDEIAHGTETYSAIGIVAAAIIEIYKKQSNFIFATHLHQLINIEKIKQLDKLGIKHLEVFFDGEKLIYNRKLQDGSGSSIYGLEFAKSIHMPENFIQLANNIRKEILIDVYQNNNNYSDNKKIVNNNDNNSNDNIILEEGANIF